MDCNSCEWKDETLVKKAKDEIISLLKKVEGMAYLLWEKSESRVGRRWWQSEWRTATAKLKRAGVETPERPGLEEADNE